jgi:hypothetical protein
LLDFLLDKNTLYNIEKNAIFAVLSDESAVSINFIDKFVDSGKILNYSLTNYLKIGKGFGII